MKHHFLALSPDTLHDCYDAAIPPAITIDSGDVVSFQTLDIAWGAAMPPDRHSPIPAYPRPQHATSDGPPLCGPVYIRGARPGDRLDVRIEAVTPGRWGWTRSGGRDLDLDRKLGVSGETRQLIQWEIDQESGFAGSQFGYRVRLSPFMGMMGVCPPGKGPHEAWTPRIYGGNLDCKELVAGSTLCLPVAVDGALFSVGDGHAVQGDGEICGMALECGMEEVRLRFELIKSRVTPPVFAQTSAEWVTFGFSPSLEEAAFDAMNSMLDLMISEYRFGERSDALAFASVAVDLRVTQMANPSFGVHAVLARDAILRSGVSPK